MDEELQAAGKPSAPQRDQGYSGESSPESYREPKPAERGSHRDYDGYKERKRQR